MTWREGDAYYADGSRLPVEARRLVGQYLLEWSLSADRTELTLGFSAGAQSGRRLAILTVEGGCCSEAWIESVEWSGPDAQRDLLRGGYAHVLAVRDLYVTEADEDNELCLQSYQTLIDTNLGTLAIEYRNRSNGYYGSDWRLRLEGPW